MPTSLATMVNQDPFDDTILQFPTTAVCNQPQASAPCRSLLPPVSSNTCLQKYKPRPILGNQNKNQQHKTKNDLFY